MIVVNIIMIYFIHVLIYVNFFMIFVNPENNENIFRSKGEKKKWQNL